MPPFLPIFNVLRFKFNFARLQHFDNVVVQGICSAELEKPGWQASSLLTQRRPPKNSLGPDILCLQLWLCESHEAPAPQARLLQGHREAESPWCPDNLASCSDSQTKAQLNHLQVSRLRIPELIILPWVAFAVVRACTGETAV